jgi:aminoglycoside 6-adenylyltransferase
MRSADEIITLLLNVATADERIRAVLLNGSRANPKVKPDRFQDFDIVYIVSELNSFIADHRWIDVFGERTILQMPDEMILGNELLHAEEHSSFAYLMLFTDGNRIDLTLFPKAALAHQFKIDSLTIVLLDKDQLFGDVPQPSDADYHIKCPTEKAFLDTCNEFWWVSTYVAKGLWRGYITYAKEMLETVVRSMFLQVVAWYIGVYSGFSVSIGKGGRYMKDHMSADLYQRVLATYPDAQPANIWQSLFTIADLFSELATKVAVMLDLKYNIDEDRNVRAYLKSIYNELQ